MDMPHYASVLPRGASLRFFDETGDNEITKGLFIGPKDNSELIAVPLADETPLEKNVGDRLRVRYGSHGAMVEFCSEIIEIIKYPVLLWRIRVPTEVNRFELRDHKRNQCFISAMIEVADKGLFMESIIRDISKSGARCAIRHPQEAENKPAAGDPVILRCTFPGIAGEQVASGSITDVDRKTGDLTVGIHFTAAQVWVPPYH